MAGSGNWTAFLPEAQKWVSQRYSVLHGHPQKKARKPRKHRLAKAHVHNALISHGMHSVAMGRAPRQPRLIIRGRWRPKR